MALIPDVLNTTKEQTLSSVAKESAHLPIALDGDYPIGGYPVSSFILFNDDKFKFLMVEGYAVAGASFLKVVHDVLNSKLIMIDMPTGLQIADHADLSTYTAYCTFQRW
jgi:hypothetical protein